MNLADVCGTDPRGPLHQALIQVLTPENSDAHGMSRFDVTICDEPSTAALSTIANVSFMAGSDVVVAIFPSEASTECTSLAVIRHEQQVTHVHFVEPCVVDDTADVVLVECNRKRAFRVEASKGIVETELPTSDLRHLGIVKAWVLLCALMKYAADPLKWPFDLAGVKGRLAPDDHALTA